MIKSQIEAIKNLFHHLLLVFAGGSYRDQARDIQYLKMENEILRGKLPSTITVTHAERRKLIRYAKKAGKAIHHLATIVTPGTVLRWIREDGKTKGTQRSVKRGRRRKPDDLRRLIVKLAKENG